MDDNREDKVKQLINGIGALVELWSITYKMFLKNGLTREDAIDSTQRLIDSVLNSSK